MGVIDGLVAEARAYAESLMSVPRLGLFLSIGMTGALCDNAVLAGLVELGRVHPVAGALVSKEAAIALMFVLNDRLTFRGLGGDGFFELLRRFLRSNAVRAGGAAMGIAVLYVLYEWFDVWYLLANVVGIGAGFLLNYSGESLVTWKVHR